LAKSDFEVLPSFSILKYFIDLSIKEQDPPVVRQSVCDRRVNSNSNNFVEANKIRPLGAEKGKAIWT